MTRSPEDEEPLPDGGSRASAADVNEEVVLEGLGCRIGFEAREAVLEMNARFGLVRETNPAG